MCLCQLLSFGIDQLFILWQLRKNQQWHGKDKEHHSEVSEQILYSKLQDLYALRERVCPADIKIFHKSFEDHTISSQTTLDGIETWIMTYSKVIHTSSTQAAHKQQH